MQSRETQTVVLVVGRPASGKTTISRAIAERWGLPLLAKDAIKERLFDALGIVDGGREWSRALGVASFSLLDYAVEEQIRGGATFVVDAAYTAERENERWRALQGEFGFTAVQVHCRAAGDELLRRFIARSTDGSRHAGHADELAVDEFHRSLDDGRGEVLDLDGPVVTYESDRPGAMEEALAEVGRLLGR